MPNCTTVTISSLILMLNFAQFIHLYKWHTFQSRASLHINETEWPQFTAHTTHFLNMNNFWDKTRTEKNSSLVPCSKLHQRYSLRTFQLNTRLAFIVPKFCFECNELKLYLPGLNNHIRLNLLCSIWLFKFLVCTIQKQNYINYIL